MIEILNENIGAIFVVSFCKIQKFGKFSTKNNNNSKIMHQLKTNSLFNFEALFIIKLHLNDIFQKLKKITKVKFFC